MSTTRGGTASSVLFVNELTSLVCLGKLGVYCWKINMKDSKASSASLQWRFQHSKLRVRCMALFGPNSVLFGTSQGCLLLVDWTKSACRRRRATFSSISETPEPQLIHEWIPKFDKLQVANGSAPSKRLAILKVHAETTTFPYKEGHPSDRIDSPIFKLQSSTVLQHQCSVNRPAYLWLHCRDALFGGTFVLPLPLRRRLRRRTGIW